MPQKPRMNVSLTPTCERLLDELLASRYNPIKRATLGTLALEVGLRAIASPTMLPPELFAAAQ